MTTMKAPGSTVERMVRNGMGLLNIEVETDWTADDIKALAKEIGWGLNIASGRFQKGAETKPVPMGVVRLVPPTDTGAVTPAQGPTSSPATVEPLAAPVSHHDLIAEGESSSVDRVRRAAGRARKALTELEGLLEHHAADEARKAKAVADKAAAAKRVADLKRQLADAVKAKDALGKNRVPVNADSQEMRSWAAENGVECPSRGMVPRRVVEAYRAAHEGAAS